MGRRICTSTGFINAYGTYVSGHSIPRSFNNITYLFTPRETINTLFSSFGLDRLAFSSYREDNVTAVLQLNDTLPSTVDVNGTAFAGMRWSVMYQISI